MTATRQGGVGHAGDVLTLGFGTAVAMWAVAYLCRLPGLDLPGPGVAVALLAVALAGGMVAGRLGPRGVAGGAWSGLLTAGLNLLVLGSFLSGDEPGALRPSAAYWVPLFLLLGAALGSLGAWLGRRGTQEPRREHNWTPAFAVVAACATFLLVVVGGMVTSHRAGLAVVDWPTSYGYNMFLYPLSRMTGGVYLEHAHRLLGSLLGLTTLVLAIYLTLEKAPRPARRLGWLAFVLVAIQGLVGGLRVTGHLALSSSTAQVAPSTGLALVHGILGQLVLAVVVALAVLTSSYWSEREEAMEGSALPADRNLARALVAALLIQLVVGAGVRHLGQGLFAHIGVAVLVTVMAVALGARLWAQPGGGGALHRLGKGLVHAVAFQVVLGILALVAIGGLEGGAPREGWRALSTTLHQANGAALLAVGVTLLLLLHRRQLVREPAAH